MSYSDYDISVPGFIHQIRALSAVFDKAVAFCEANKIEPAAMLAIRLYPNMFDLATQIRAVCFQAVAGPSLVANREQPPFPMGENNVTSLKQLMNETVTYLQGIKASEMEGDPNRAIQFRTPPGMMLPFKANTMILRFSIPNFYFHVTTAYDIIRQMGVDVGKAAFLGHGLART